MLHQKKCCLVICLLIIFQVFSMTCIFADETDSSTINPYQRYLVQVGAYHTEEKANLMYERIRKLGYDAIRIEYPDYIRIFAGVFENCTFADDLVRELGFKDIDSFIRSEDYRDVAKWLDLDIEEEIVLEEGVFVKNTEIGTDITRNGVFGSYVFFFTKEDRWILEEDNYFELSFSRSQLVDYPNSTLTFYVNDKPVYSMFMNDEPVYRANLKVPIPKEYISDGFNKLEIKSFHRISDLICEDDLNPANWIVYYKESFVHLEFKQDDKPYYLKEYPLPYLDNSYDDISRNTILVPDNFRKIDLTTALSLTADFGKRYRLEDLDVKINRFSAFDEKDKSNLIFVGGPNEAPLEIMNLITESEKAILDNSVFVKQVRSPYNENYKLLIVLSENEMALEKAAKLLSDDDLLCQVRGNIQVISKDTTLVEKDIEKLDEENITFETLGYGGVLLDGLFQNDISYGFDIPNDWMLKEGSQLVLKTRYSEALNFEKSAVTVYINNIPIGSRLLDINHANDDTLIFDIPDSFAQQLYYDIRVSYFLNVSEETCERRTTNFAWAYVSDDSYIDIEYDKRSPNYLEHYVSPFVKDSEFNDLLFVLPTSVSEYELGFLSRMMAYIGRSLEKTTGFDIIYENEFEEKYEDRNIIVVGTLEDNSLISEVNDELWIKLSEDGKAFESNDELTLLDDYRFNLASIQMIESPFNENCSMLVLTATDREKLKLILNYLSVDDYRNKLFGNAVLIDDYGKIKAGYFGQEAVSFEEDKTDEQFIPLPDDDDETDPNLKYYIIFFVIILLMVILGTILLYARKKKAKPISQ